MTWLSCLIFLAPAIGDVELDRDTSLTITEEGPFDTAKGLLKEMMTRNLMAALDKKRLIGPGDRVTIVIRTRAARWKDLPAERIQTVTDIDAFEIEIARRRITITGQTPVAAGYGVLHFLEKHIGILWAFPGELGRCLPKKKAFRLKEGTERISPWVIARAISGLSLSDPRRRKRDLPNHGVVREQRGFFMAPDYFRSLRLHPGTVSHNMIKIFPVEECKASHPEVFPLKENGERFIPAEKPPKKSGRKAYQSWHPCYSNPKTVEIAIEKGRRAFSEGRLFYSLGINDGRRVQCRCAECLKTGWPQSYYRFVNRVADALKRHHPPHMVGVLAYGDVGVPPKDLKLRDNVLVNVAGVRKSVWEGLVPAMGSYEYIYGAGRVIPNLPLDVMQENLRYYRKHKLRMYYAELYPVWAFDAPKAYIVTRLLWDPDQDVRALLRTFCERAYGAAAGPMFRYYDTIASIRKGDVREGEWTAIRDNIWPFRHPLQFHRCPKDLHDRLFRCLNEARAADMTERERARVAMVEAFTEFSAVYFEIHRLKEKAFAGARDVAEAEELKKRRESVFAAFKKHPEWFEGSSMDLEGLSDRVWPITGLDQQLECAIVTARTPDGGRSVPLKPLRRGEHSWYKPEQFLPMKPKEDGRGFRFESARNVTIRPEEDPRHHGKLKAQWLHAQAKGVQGRTLLTLKLEGHKGIADVRIQGATRSGDRRKIVFAELVLAFGDDPEEALRRVAIEPKEETVLQIYIRWRPDDTASRLQGTAALLRN
jgi:hypothetical protein